MPSRTWVRTRLMVALTLTFGLLVFLYPEIKQDYVLSQRGQQTIGTLIDRFCGRQSSAAYAFKVGNLAIRGRSALGHGTPSCWDLRSEDRLVLYYLPDDPDVNALGDPKENLKQKLIFWTAILSTLNVFIALIPIGAGKLEQPKD